MLWLDREPEQTPVFTNTFFRRHPLGVWVAPAYRYPSILGFCAAHSIALDDRAAQFFAANDLTHQESLDPFDFQKEAIEAWEKAGRRGIVVLPTGAGKSFMTRLLLARIAIEDAQCSALIVVPTRALLYQWHAQLHAAFDQEIGVVGDDLFDLQPITMTTYASARIHMSHLGNRWKLVVYDEVHRKMGKGTSSNAATFCVAPFRLALTATPSSRDLPLLTELIGPVVYEKSTDDLIERQVLSTYETIKVHLSPTRKEVEKFHRIKQPMESVRSRAKQQHRIQDGSWLVRERYYYPDEVALAQRSLLQAYRYWQSLPSRFARLEEILLKHPQDRIIVFTESRWAAYEVSRRFLIPPVTADIDSDERAFYLKAFAHGKCRALVTAKALEEGIDLPDANVAVILAGRRQRKTETISYIQRRGRILRKRSGKHARVYEIAWAAPQSKRGAP
ncbi:MAG: DEAD/DEAH box helicase [Bacteroidota bacterium]